MGTATYAENKAKVKGKLEEHVCCPECGYPSPTIDAHDVVTRFDQQLNKTVPDGTKARPAKDTDAARCRCGWKGKVSDLVDTVAAGHTTV